MFYNSPAPERYSSQVGIEVKIGAKNSEIKKQKPVVMAVKPVRPPSAIQLHSPQRWYRGNFRHSDPIEITMASVQKARVERGNEHLPGQQLQQIEPY